MSENIKRLVIETVVEPVISNPKVQMGIATGTTATAIDMATVQYLQPIIAIVAATLGLILTTVLIIRNVLLIVDEYQVRRQKVRAINETSMQDKA